MKSLRTSLAGAGLLLSAVVLWLCALLQPLVSFVGEEFGYFLWTLAAASIVGLFTCIFLLWRARSEEGHHCHSCGYDRAGLARQAPCPECGKT